MKTHKNRIDYLSDKKISQDFVHNWYEYANEDHFWMYWRLLALMKFMRKFNLPLTQPLCAMDIGSGNGILAKQIENFTSWTVDQVELNENALIHSYKGRGNSLFYNILEEKPSLLGKYDLIFAFDVIEHLENPIPFLRAASRHLKDSGILLVDVPALNFLMSRYDQATGHLRRYNKKSLAQILFSSGMAFIQSDYWGTTLVPVLFLRKCLLSFQKHLSNETIIQKGFQPPFPFVNRVFKLIARIESCFPIYFIGASLLSASRKNVTLPQGG